MREPFTRLFGRWKWLERQPRKISEEFKARHPSLPWRVMAGMRDKLIHDYIRVDLEVVWETVTRNIPDIVPQIRRLLSDVDSGSDL